MDTTYFGRSFGVMVFLDNKTGVILDYKIVPYETNKYYHQGIKEIQSKGIHVHSIICDGRRGLLGSFGSIPTQMCHFHQIQIIIRYLTRNPKHYAGKELKTITLQLPYLNKEQFIQILDNWYMNYKDYINERSYDENKTKSWYTHKRLRSAYHSLRRNMPYLFVYQETGNHYTPNTTNKLEGIFSHLKQSLRCHQGLNQTRKLKFIDNFFQQYR